MAVPPSFSSPPVITQLLKIIRESIKAVPAMKYALAVAGVLSVVALVGAFRLSPQTAVFGAVITLVLMVAMVIFARLTTTAPRHFFLPVTIMLWAFLLVTVGTAFLLFTSAFFHWPRGLRELMDPRPATPTQSSSADPRAHIAAARQQRLARDYEAAWHAIEQARAAAPDSTAAADEQQQIAMAWLRDLRVRAPETYTSLVRPLTASLHLHATAAKGTEAADIHAHLGWANFLRYREGVRDLPIEEEYARALALDPKNPFAHAMWGHWLATRRRPLPEVLARFDAALQAGRERPAVQRLRLAALMWMDTLEAGLELLRAVDEIRRSGEPLDPSLPPRLFTSTYSRWMRQHEPELLAALPAADNLATFQWLARDRNLADSAMDTYTLARLTEAAGDLPAAAALYRSLLPLDSVLQERIEAGLQRCAG